MKFGVPWSVKGIRPEARETAREAARRSGMSLGDWLNSVILQQAQENAHAAALDDDEESYGEDLSSVHQRLDDITRRIEQFSRTGPAAYAPKRGRNDTDQLAELIGRLDRRIDQFVSTAHALPQAMMPHMAPSVAPAMGYAPQPMAQPSSVLPSLDRAIAEIGARQRALNGAPAQARQQTAAPQRAPELAMPAQQQQPLPAVLMPVPTQNLSGLEDQLRRITDQIETLRKPGVEEAINALRGELGEIGRTLNDAMPRRAIDAIEKQIQGLTQRIAEGRQAGVDGGAIAGVEHGLAEVRDALRGLTPAENLVGFNEAVHGLAHKIDLIVAQKDPATLNQLEHAITTLRDMASHVASNEAVGSLAMQVQMLADKVEHMSYGGPAGDALNSLEHRIDALSRALAERAQNGNSVPPRLEALVQSLSDKIELIQQRRGDNVAVDHLEDRIVQLVERLDLSDSRLGHLETIERGLADLLVHIEDIRSNKQSEALRADNSSVDALKNDLARTQNVLEAVNGTLGHVVDRLAVIEKDIRGEARNRPAFESETLELSQPTGKLAVRLVNDAPETAPRMPHAAQLQVPQQVSQQVLQQLAQPAPQPQPVQAARPQPAPHPVAQPPKRLPPANHGPIDPDLPPDQPLEPGSGPPRLRANPGARIAASEAALGPARPAPAAAGGKSSFIAAARRAAQAAVEEASSHLPRSAPALPGDAEAPSLRAKLMPRVKSLFIAASIVAVVIGAVQIMGSMINRSPAPPAVKSDNADILKSERPANLDQDDAAPGAPANPLAPSKPADRVPSLTMPAPPNPPSLGNMPPMNLNQSMPSLLNPPAMNPPATPSNDVTGSIAKPARQPETGPAVYTDRLPVALGGPRLRNAALAGNSAAAYEVAMRYAEGRGVPVNLEEAARWYERASAKGLAPAQFRYASLLEKGQGVKKDLAQARRLYVAAAAKGNAKAMHNLAVLYAEGIEGRPDYATAAQWFTKAALHGLPDSQYNLGVLAARGLGTQKNLADSYKWFALAADQGDKEAARKRDEVGSQLDPATLAAAKRAVANFVPEKQPADAFSVPEPQGGWDNAGTTPAPQGKARPAAPITLGAVHPRKR